MVTSLPERLQRLLEHMMSSLDPARQDEIDDLHRRALAWEPVDRLPVIFSYPLPQDGAYRPDPHRAAIDDPAKMLYNQLVHAWDVSPAYHDWVGDDLPITIRANFGTVVMASLFGGHVEQIEDNPPWVRPFETMAEFGEALERDPGDYTQGWCPRVLERYQFYSEVLDSYPELRQTVRVVLPDLQGPLDTAELLRGSDIYVDFYACPERVCQALGTLSRAQVGFAEHLESLLADGPAGHCHQHGFLIRGKILIRDDSAILISPKMYRALVAPHDQMILHAMGGGGIHACGNLSHVAGAFLELPDCRCLDFGQAGLNPVGNIYDLARERKIPLLRVQVTEEALATGQVMDRFPTGVSLLFKAKSVDHAREVMHVYQTATQGSFRRITDCAS